MGNPPPGGRTDSRCPSLWLPFAGLIYWSTAIERLPSGRDRIRAWVAHTCNHLADTSPVHEIIRVAAGTEPFVAQLRAQLLEERLSLQRHRARQLLPGILRSEVTLDDAADRYSAASQPRATPPADHGMRLAARTLSGVGDQALNRRFARR